jgi:hemerythrin-like domain-containing protein
MKHTKTRLVLSAFSFAVMMVASPVRSQEPHSHAATTATAAATQSSATGQKATAEFRNTHKTELEHLGHVETWSGALAAQSPEEQKQTAAKIIDYFRNGLIKHAEWEETHLYPLIDKLTNSEKNPFTSTMRHEHKIVVRSIEALEKEAAKPQPDYADFARKTDMLLGLVRAHFELEDEVLLPYIDKSMTREQFEEAIGGHH